MAELTPELGLIKPNQNEIADIDVLNKNMDTIDSAMKGKLSTEGGTLSGGLAVANGYGYLCGFDASGTKVAAIDARQDDDNFARLQVNKDPNGKAHAFLFNQSNGIKESVYELLHMGNGLPLTGGTLSGSLVAKDSITSRNESVGRDARIANGSTGATNLVNAKVGDSSNYASLLLGNENTALNSLLSVTVGKDGTAKNYPIYGTHNITVSTSAPTSAMATGAMHMTY